MSKVVIVYLSTSGNTKLMADAIAEGAMSKNIAVMTMNFHEARIEEIKAADAIIIGSSTFYYKMLPPMEKFLESLEKINVQSKIGATFGSYGWSGEAPKLILEIMKYKFEMKTIEPPLLVKNTPDQNALNECRNLGKKVSESLMNRV